MKPHRPAIALLLLVIAALLGASPRLSQPAQALSSDIVISQVYGSGGTVGAIYTHDFIELFNRGSSAVNLAGWSLQYTSATGTQLFGATATQLTELTGTLQPGQYLLVEGLTAGAVGSALPAPDIVDATPIDIGGTSGKVALVTSATGLGCNGGSTPCDAGQLALIKDLVGYGTANFYEGTAAAPAQSTTIADFRGGNGCTETDDNSADFLTAAPGPRNTASPPGVCTTGAENIVISQVYGGGGNSLPDAPYTHDYVELFNRGSSAVNLAGWSIQYASATGTGTFGADSATLTELSGSLQPGQYLLVQEGTVMTSPVGSPLPTPDITDATPISISGVSGKVVLANSTLPLGCNGGSAACSPGALASIVDLVGYGTANFFEGAGAAPGLTNIIADFRNNNGCTDTDNNSADFTAAAPAPRNTASTFNVCPGNDTAPSVTGTSPADNDTNVAANAAVTVTFDEAVTITGTVPIVCGANPAEDVTPTTSDNLTFTLPHADFPAGETCTVTINGAQVSDNDTDDPPDGMAADFVFDFSVLLPTGAQVFTAAAAGTADNETEPDVAYQTGDVLRWDGAAWTKFFDGTDNGLPASADIIALDVIDPNTGSLYLVWRQQLSRVPDVNNGAPGRVSPWEVVAFDGAAFTRFFDGRDVGLTLAGERINGLEVLPGKVAPINGGNCQAYLLISTMAGGAVRNGADPVIRFTGEDVLGFCMLTGGANSTGLWHLAFEGQGNGLVKNSTLGLAASDDALTLYFTSKKTYPAGVNKILPFAQPSGPFGAPLFDAKAAGLVKLVDSIDYIP